ncbi:MAG TPA: PIG-L deacetylase family protein [Nonomuraea sp.]|nr:PIG-L deacetylase family protein [Nonomuraea sp.]
MTAGRRSHPAPPFEVRAVIAVVAHPDDESFGLGAVLDRLIEAGAEAGVLCFTRGEASTLHPDGGDLAEIRAAELRSASAVLGVGHTRLLDYPDGRLDQVPLDDLAGQVLRFARTVEPSHLLVFDTGGVTGHPDHVHATRAALRAADDLGMPVLGWTIPQDVADALNAEFGTGFTGHRDEEAGQRFRVDRTRQYRAIRCHRSQATDNPVLYRRLELLGAAEHVRLLRPAPENQAGRKASGKDDHPAPAQAVDERTNSWITA